MSGAGTADVASQTPEQNSSGPPRLAKDRTPEDRFEDRLAYLEARVQAHEFVCGLIFSTFSLNNEQRKIFREVLENIGDTFATPGNALSDAIKGPQKELRRKAFRDAFEHVSERIVDYIEPKQPDKP